MSRKALHKNQNPIRLNSYNYCTEIPLLDFKCFPIIDDFEITTKAHNNKKIGIHLYFYSPSYNRNIASFPWWDNVDLNLKNMDIDSIPLGKVNNPFDDLEQGWQILIWEKRDYVYIMQGEDSCCTEFSIWFKVSKEIYINEWVKVIQLYK